MTLDLRRLVTLALLPLSILPVVLSLPKVEDEYEGFRRAYVERDPLPAPTGMLTREEAERWKPVPVPKGRIPVLVYHGINSGRGRLAVTRERFAEQMAMLAWNGFETVSIETYARFLRGEPVRLPEKPLLLTFDDSRLDSFRGADAVLARHGFRATMFAISGRAGRSGSPHSSWDELREMQESGRWDVQFHAGDGHESVRIDARGREAPFYANRMHGESFGAARDRIMEDLAAGEGEMAEQIPGYEPFAFAVPFGELGQHETNDPAIPRMLRLWVGYRFDVTFVQGKDPEFSAPGRRGEIVQRFEVRSGTTTDELHRWLARYAAVE